MPRPKGRKNNATLMKESEIAKCLKLCEGHAALEAPAIVYAMAEKAKEGDVAAAKLILDRVYPARQDSSGQRLPGGITINIQSTDQTETRDAIDQKGSEADHEPAEPADRQESFRAEGVEILAFDAGQKR